MPSTFPFWWVFAGLLAIETLALVGIALGLRGLTPSSRWCRVIWHCCFLALGLLLLSAMTGAGRRFAGWVGAAGPHVAARATGQLAGMVSPANTLLSATQTLVVEPLTTLPSSGETPLKEDRERAGGLPDLDASMVVAEEHLANVDVAAPAGLAAVSSLVSNADSRSWRVARWFEVSDGWWGALWGAGVTLVLLRVGLARCLSMLFQLRRQPFPDAGLHARVQALASRLGCRRPITVLESPGLIGPVALGLARPTIMLPGDFATRFSATQQEAVLAHEVAHLAAHDPAWHFLADGVTALLWWHPLVWHARRELHRASEHAADEASLVVENGPRVLAECLVALGRQRWGRRSAVALGVEGQGLRSGLGRRVERLIHLREKTWRPLNSARSCAVKTAVPALVAVVAILSSAWAIPQALTQGDPMTQLHQTWKRSLAAVTLAVSLGTDLSSSRLAAQPSPATPTPAAEEKAPAAPENSTPAPDAAAEKAVVPAETPAPSDPSDAAPPAKPGMSAEMMRRYAILGTTSAAADIAAASLDAETIRRLETSRLETLNEYTRMNALYEGLLAKERAVRRDVISTAYPDNNLAELEMRYAQAETELAALSKDYGDEHPNVIRANRVLAKINQQIDTKVDAMMDGIKERVVALKVTLDQTTATLQEAKNDLAATDIGVEPAMSAEMVRRYGLTPAAAAPAAEGAAPASGVQTAPRDTESFRRLVRSRFEALNEYTRENSLYTGMLAKGKTLRRNMMSTVWPDESLADMEKRFAQAQQELAGLSTDKGQDHPDVKRAQGVVAKIDQQIDVKVDNMMGGMKERVASLKATLDQTTAALKEAKTYINAQANFRPAMRRRFSEQPPTASEAQPGMSAEMMRRYGLTPTTAQSNSSDEAPVAAPAISPELMRRYDLRYQLRTLAAAAADPTAAEANANGNENDNQNMDADPSANHLKRGPKRAQILRQLETIYFDQITFPDGILLGQAVQMLSEEVRKKDPAGINWVISQVPDRDRRPLDPATGLPVADSRNAGNVILLAPQAGEIALHANHPLRGLTLRAVLDVITKVAEQPLRYSIENYGVVFALGNPGEEPMIAAEEPRPAMSAAMMRRYGMTPAPQAAEPSAASQLRAKLDKIVFTEFKLPHGMTLSDAVKYLDEQTRQQDPGQKGVNFILTRFADGAAGQPGIDPTTGLPVPAATGIGDVSVRGGLDLRQVTLKDVLEALTKVVDAPIRYAVQNYGVIISPDSPPATALASGIALRSAHPKSGDKPRLVARSFQLDKRHFLPRLRATFGIDAPGIGEPALEAAAAGAGTPKSSADYVKSAVVKLAEHLGVTFRNPPKEIFYNDETGMLMLRATGEDLETMAAAMETLSDGTKIKNERF